MKGLRIPVLVILAILAAPGAADPAWQAAPQPALSPADQADLKSVIDAYFAAHVAKDVNAFGKLWHPGAIEGRGRTNVARALFAVQDFTFANLRVLRVTRNAEEAAARISVEATTAYIRRRQTEKRTWFRDFTFRQDAGAWRLWHEGMPIEDLAASLAAAKTEEERIALLDAEPDLITDELRAALGRQSNTAAGRRDPKAALFLLELAAEVARRTKDPASISSAYIELGLEHQTRGRFDAALASFERALTSLRTAGDKGRTAATEMNIASVYYRLQKYPDAAEYYQKALDNYEAVGETGWSASILHSLGNCAYLRADWPSALDYYRRSLAIQEKTAVEAGERATMLQQRGLAAACQAIGMVHQAQADYPSAIEAFERSLESYAAYDDKSGMVNVEGAIGEVYRQQGDFALSLRHLLAAYGLAGQMRPDVRDKANEAKLLAEIGEVYAQEQRYQTALDYFRRSLELHQQVNNKEGTAAVEGGIGGVSFLQGMFPEALEHYGRSLALREELNDTHGAALTLAQIGLVHAADGRQADALASYEKSLERATRADDKSVTAIALVLIASAQSALDRTEDALGFAEKGAALADEIGNLDVFAHAKLVLGDVRRLRGETDAADRAVREAIVAVERLRASGARADERFFNDTVSPYLAMVHLLVEQNRTEDAFAMLEQARQLRMQALLDGGASVVKGLTAEEQAEELRLRRRVASLRAQARKASNGPVVNPETLSRLARELAEATEARNLFEGRLFEAHPELRTLRAKGDLPGLPAASERLLDARTGLLEFAVTETRTYLFVLTRAARAAPLALRVYPIDVRPTELGKAVGAFRNQIGARGPDTDAKARELYELLLKPAEEPLAGKRRLLIVPDASLWTLPFQALQPADGRFLIEDRAVAYGSSLAALVAATRYDPATIPAARALRLVAAGLAQPDKPTLEHLSFLRPDLSFQALANAELEARSLTTLFPATRARVHVAADARADRVRADAKTAQVLHLAVPAVLNDASPLHSLVAFAPPSSAASSSPAVAAAPSPLPSAVAPTPPSPGMAPADRDGTIDAGDIMSWELSARLVVLSRVHGDPGQDNAGAATRAVAWAWLVAGSPTTVLSQRVVDSPSTGALMRAFHARLAAPSPQRVRPSDALRQATLPMLRGQWRHPFYWAQFMVLGDGR